MFENIKKSIKKMFLRYIETDVRQEGTCVVRFLNDDKNASFGESLGLDDERTQVLAKNTLKAYSESKSLSEAAEKFSQICRHPNELLFCTYVASDHHFKQAMLGDMMGRMFHGSSKGRE